MFGKPLAKVDITHNDRTTSMNTSYQDTKEFIFVSTTLKEGFISSILNQYVVYVREILMKPLKRLRKTKCALLEEYEKMKAQW